MAITIRSSELFMEQSGYQGCGVVRGCASFHTPATGSANTDATGDIPVPFGTVFHVNITPWGTLATDEAFYIHSSDHAVSTTGKISLPATRALSIRRTGTPTSGLYFFFEIFGR